MKRPKLDALIYVERLQPHSGGSDGAGNFEQAWAVIGPARPLRAELREVPQGSEEAVIAGALRGVARATVTVRASAFTRSITTNDRFRVAGTDRVLNIRHAPPPGRERHIAFGCESGVAT